MKLDTPVPFARLNWFHEKLGLGDREQQSLAKQVQCFATARGEGNAVDGRFSAT